MYKPIAIRKKLSRKGIRQPQEKKASSGSAETSAKMPAESSRPAGTPACMVLP